MYLPLFQNVAIVTAERAKCHENKRNVQIIKVQKQYKYLAYNIDLLYICYIRQPIIL
jgi:hypothetical protein